MLQKCPGQDSRNITLGIITCHKCGAEAEIFSDEMETSCPSCRTPLVREKLPSCIDWCSYSWYCKDIFAKASSKVSKG